MKVIGKRSVSKVKEQITIQQYSEAFSGALRQLYIESFAQRFRIDGFAFVDMARKGDCWLAVLGTELVGYMVFKPGFSPYLQSIAVSKEYQGHGIAYCMLQCAERYYSEQDCNYLLLETHVDNPAQKLYFDFGFRVCEFKEDLYGAQENGIAMMKAI